jgi:hypothetical protein
MKVLRSSPFLPVALPLQSFMRCCCGVTRKRGQIYLNSSVGINKSVPFFRGVPQVEFLGERNLRMIGSPWKLPLE